MHFLDLPEDIIVYIWNFLVTNKDSISLIKTCKYLHELGMNNGYIKELSIQKFSPINFQIKSVEHFHSIIYMVVDSVNWLPRKWPEKVTFIQCELNGKIDPVDIVKTRKLHLKLRRDRKDSLKISWEKFPSLEELYISAYDIDLKGIELCQKLSSISISLGVVNKKIPTHLFSFSGDLKLNLPKLRDYYPPDNKRFQAWKQFKNT